MRFYRVHVPQPDGTSNGFEFYTAEAEARSRAHGLRVIWKERAKVEPILIEPTKAGILAALRYYAAHPDNG
jgi:hypothetical protein